MNSIKDSITARIFFVFYFCFIVLYLIFIGSRLILVLLFSCTLKHRANVDKEANFLTTPPTLVKTKAD